MGFAEVVRSQFPHPELGTWMHWSDKALNEQDKTLDFDVKLHGKLAIVQGIRIEYIAQAGAGTRSIEVSIRDSTDILRLFNLNTAATAAVATTNYEVGRGLTPPSSPGAGIEHDTLPDGFVFLTGQALRIRATTNANAADDMEIHVFLQVF